MKDTTKDTLNADEKPVYKGTLFVQSWLLLRKSWSKKLCVLYDTSAHGVRRLEMFDTEEHFTKKTNGKIFVLEDAVKVQTLPKKEINVIEIITEKRGLQLRVDSRKEMTEWLDRLKSVAFNNNNSTNNAENIMNINNNNNNNNSDQNNEGEGKGSVFKVEENDLYGSVDDTFCVKLISTPASEKCGLDPSELNYVITLTPDSMVLRYGDLNNFYSNEDQSLESKKIFEWYYPYIRRYGIVNGFFSFEAGRKCPSGEGLFSFDAPDVRKIFECLASYMKLAGEKRKHLKNTLINATNAANTDHQHHQPPPPPPPLSSSRSTCSSPIDATYSKIETLQSQCLSIDENCQGCRSLNASRESSSSASSSHDDSSITFGRACAAPQTPIMALYANIDSLESMESSRPQKIEHIIVGDGVEYARVVKTTVAPPPLPPPHNSISNRPSNETNSVSAIITRMESVENLDGNSH